MASNNFEAEVMKNGRWCTALSGASSNSGPAAVASKALTRTAGKKAGTHQLRVRRKGTDKWFTYEGKRMRIPESKMTDFQYENGICWTNKVLACGARSRSRSPRRRSCSPRRKRC